MKFYALKDKFGVVYVQRERILAMTKAEDYPGCSALLFSETENRLIVSGEVHDVANQLEIELVDWTSDAKPTNL